MFRIFLIIAFGMHGLANLAGVLAPWKSASVGFSDARWLFSAGVSLSSTTGRIFSLDWLRSSMCLVASSLGLLLYQHWWLALAISGSVFSLIAIASSWRAVPAGARFGAVPLPVGPFDGIFEPIDDLFY